MKSINWNQMSELGLIERFNREILHPLGLAVSRDVYTGASGEVLVADDGIWEYCKEMPTTIISNEAVKEKLGLMISSDSERKNRVVKAITRDELVLVIPAEYLENAFEMGVTTNVTGKVTDRDEMLQYFANEFDALENDSKFGRFIDSVCEEAIDDGELFVECAEDEEE